MSRPGAVEPIEILAVAVDDDAERNLVAFAASETNPDDVLIVARAKRFDAQDVASGTDTHCIVTGSSGATHYGGIEEVEWADAQRLRVRLDRDAAADLVLPVELELVLPDAGSAELVRDHLPALLA